MISSPYVIGLASLPGAGKGQLAEQLASLDVGYLHVGSLVRSTAQANGFVPAEETRQAYLPFWREYSSEHGQDWLARIALQAAEDTKRPVVMDGVRIVADAITIAAHGVMAWLEADLPTLAERVMERNKIEDRGIGSIEDYVTAMNKELAGVGNFSMGDIRDLCTLHLLPIPQIQDTALRAAHYHSLAEYVLQTR